jgi:hypothetical protein
MPVASAALGVQAFYILFANQIDSPDWPHKVCQNGGHGPQGSECVDATAYRNGVFITSPQNITAAHIAKVKRDVPGAKVVGYWDFGEMPLYANENVCPFCTGHVMGDKAGRNCTTTYPCGRGTFTDALNATVPHELLIRRRTGKDKNWVLVEAYPGLAAYCWNSKLAPLLAKFLGGWLAGHGFDGLYLDGYVEADRIHIATTAPTCSVVDVGQYTGPLMHLDTPDNVTNLAPHLGGKCGFGAAPCNITDLKLLCDKTDNCGGFNSNGWLKAGPLTKDMLIQTSTAVKDNSSFWLRNGSAVTCEWDYDGDGQPDTPLEHAVRHSHGDAAPKLGLLANATSELRHLTTSHLVPSRVQGMYWAWRPAFVAEVRKILGDDAVILANSAGAVSDPSLSGITIEMESCVGKSMAAVIYNAYQS